MKKQYHWLLFALISLITGIISFFYVHFTSDNVMLFTATRFFESRWLAKGIFPLFMPNMYAGIPFAFDLGLPNFHPFNLLFILPYPWSYAVFVAGLTFLFLSGFYLLFHEFNRDRSYSLFLTLVLFFSGSGFIRLANPTVYAAVAHMGLFGYALLRLKSAKIKDWLFAFLAGVLLTFSGQLPIVLFGYILGLFICLYGGIPSKKTVIYFFSLFILVSWYFVLSIPLNFGSTRMTSSSDYSAVGNLSPLHVIAWFFPYMFGELRSGSNWFIDIPYQTYLPLIGLLLALFAVWKGPLWQKLLLFVFFLSSLGLIHLPFLRGAVQIYILIHITVLLFATKRRKEFVSLMSVISNNYVIIAGIALSVLSFVFFQSGFFSSLFFRLYHLVKKVPSLYYDPPTIKAVGVLISHNFLVFAFFFLALLIAKKFPKAFLLIFSVMVIIEGTFFNYVQMFFIPTALLTAKASMPKQMDTVNYRTQSTSDTIAYTGYFVYQENITLQPPFSKEKSMFTPEERRTFAILKSIFATVPSSWAAVAGTSSVQGYSTFVPKKICRYFHEPSANWRTEYQYIIDKNPLFGIKVEDLCINNIETSRITMEDLRWAELGVRYFISDRPLKSYTLIAQDGTRYFYENTMAPSLYRLQEKSGYLSNVSPTYTDPNKMVFSMTKADIGKKLIILINPDGFVALQNAKELPIAAHGFQMSVPVTAAGKITVKYSPVRHLQQTVQALLSHKSL